ncbi:mannitol dehydrogenase family protein [Tropicimonas sp. IMCC34043]|uniref:mannitol dehydrogenase family protein n=1 Tax=Tropicimonas sp. IMCC34043 TaxID=2248760 RepID=UPI000E2400D4|nr:mannitol dehydrogenase family protein [Tropicimonas sp. IMCC34043]
MQPTPILQFGTSRFLQAHVDLFVSEAMAEGQDVGPITVVQSSGDPARARRLQGLVGAYPVRIEGLANGAKVQQQVSVRSIARTLSTATDWDAITRTFVNEAEFVVSNTGDAGYAPQPADTAATFEQSMSYPAKLLCLLRARYAAGAAPIQIMPMELIADNGAVLRQRVLDLAADDPAALRDWLQNDVLWVNSLVDRIVSEPLEPAGAVAEPYALWAIEDQPGLRLPCRHPSIQVLPSLAQIEALKLFVLNLGHSFLADRWRMAQGPDDVLVRQLMADPVTLGALNAVLQDEVRPAFVAAGLSEAFDAYVVTTRDRFANPFLDHRIADIAQNHGQKVGRRIAAMLDWARAQGDLSAKPTLSAIVARNTDMAS